MNDFTTGFMDNITIVVRTRGKQELTDKDIAFITKILRDDGESEDVIDREIERLKMLKGYVKEVQGE